MMTSVFTQSDYVARYHSSFYSLWSFRNPRMARLLRFFGEAMKFQLVVRVLGNAFSIILIFITAPSSYLPQGVMDAFCSRKNAPGGPRSYIVFLPTFRTASQRRFQVRFPCICHSSANISLYSIG